jgi:hypothetical protein
MHASTSQAPDLPAWFTDAEAKSDCNLPSFFKCLPFEIQDHILRYILCDFPRPEKSDPTNNGIYIGEHQDLALMPWRIDTGILNHPDEEVQRRARRVMVVENQLVYIKSETLNLLPIFHAARVPIVTMGIGRWTRSRVEVLSKYFHITHQIELQGRSITGTGKPWGQTHQSLEAIGLKGPHVPKVQEFVILWKDLAHFCRALDGADSGYYRFGLCTEHTLGFHRPCEDLLEEHIPILCPSRLLHPYRDILRGFESFTIQGRIAHNLARAIEMEVGSPIKTPRPNDIVQALIRQLWRGNGQLTFNQPVDAAHTFARAAQELMVLHSKGVLPRRADGSPWPELAELYFELEQRQAKAWLFALEKQENAAEGSQRKEVQPSTIRQLVYNATPNLFLPPPPLRHKPSDHQHALQLYHVAKADRLSDTGDWQTWLNIDRACSLDPENATIRREAELIRKHIQEWKLRRRSERSPTEF